MSGGNLSGVYHFYTVALTAATMVQIYIYRIAGILQGGGGGIFRS